MPSWNNMYRWRLRINSMLRNKADISLGVIVVAAIALVVFIVLIIIFGSRMGLVNREFSECPVGTITMDKSRINLGFCPDGSLPRKKVFIKEKDEYLYCCEEPPCGQICEGTTPKCNKETRQCECTATSCGEYNECQAGICVAKEPGIPINENPDGSGDGFA